MSDITPITVAYGDGIGPEIMQAALDILKEAEAKIRLEVVEVGEKLYQKNYSSGIAESTWQNLDRTKILFKSPITTPQGGGYKSLNVTLRNALGLFANIRPSVSYHPFVATKHPDMDLIIVRENEEDLYAGIEYRHSHNMRESMKLISRTGCQKIIRYAFEYAAANNRQKVTCMSKDNIMKFSDGLFHQVFDEISKDYPNIENDHYIIDIGTARLASNPGLFGVVVTSNLFGDIASDVTAEISGSVGLAGSSNIGRNFAMFEAIHGSAPDIAGQDIANPSGLINAAVMMLVYIGQGRVASLVENAWKHTIEQGVHTADIYNKDSSSKKVGCKEFAKTVIANLGKEPVQLKAANYQDGKKSSSSMFDYKIEQSEQKVLVGCDIFIGEKAGSADEIAAKIPELEQLKLKTIASKGLKLWPRNDEFLIEADHWCCRYMQDDGGKVASQHVAELVSKFANMGLDFVKVENLYEFDGKRGYSLAQGE